MTQSEKIKLARLYFDKGYNYEQLKYGDDLYDYKGDVRDELADEIWDYVKEIRSCGMTAFNKKYNLGVLSGQVIETPQEVLIRTVNGLINTIKTSSIIGVIEVGEISDGYHTFNELYEFRKVYNAMLFNEWADFKNKPLYEPIKYDVHKSRKHHDGELCFGGDWFIVSAMLPTGLISNHYHIDDWDLFKVPEVDKAKYEFDGHTSSDVLERMLNLIKKQL